MHSLFGPESAQGLLLDLVHWGYSGRSSNGPSITRMHELLSSRLGVAGPELSKQGLAFDEDQARNDRVAHATG